MSDNTSEAQCALHSNFFTNRDGNTLMKEFEGILSHNSHIRHLDAVVGFLRASGYFSLRPFLNGIDKARVLIGIDVDKYIVEAARREKLFIGAEEQVKDDCLREIRRDIEHSGYTEEIESGILQMIDDLVSGKLELRAHPSKRIHAKMYVLYPDGFNQYTQGMAITGSSNLSGNGLGISQDKQYEFNVKLNRYEDVQYAKTEFELLWAEAEGCEITAEDIKTEVEKTYLKGDVSPYDLYIKMLMEYFSDRVLATDDEDPFVMPEGYESFEYQTDAVVEGYQKLLRYDGFFLADVVGLGKTVIATMIAKKFLNENGRERTKILVVYPPAVEQNWKVTFRDFGIDKYTQFVSNGSLSKILDGENFYWKADEFDLVLVDEAHKFRTHTTNAFEQLQEICKMPRIAPGNIPGYKKKVMLISATPMNNTPADLYNQILLFQDPRRCTIDGVPNLTSFFSPLIADFKRLRSAPNADAARFDALSEEVRNRIIKPLTVRRTRSDIESIPRYSKGITGFPKVEKPIESRYELNEHVADLFEQTMTILTQHLKYARYQAIAYLKPEAAEGLYDNAELVSRNLAGIRKNSLVKRLESSFFAFTASVRNFRRANRNMLDMFANDKVFIAPDMDVNVMLENGMSEEDIEEKLNAKAEENPKNAVFRAADFDPRYLEILREDQQTLEQMCADWETVTEADDSKFAKFSDLLRHELFKTDRNPGQKLVVFSESVDTVKYLEKRINRKDVLVISAANRGKLFKTIRENFDANYTKERKNDYNIILTTDVLAEGVNLHRANVIVNYDTPWNSTRLMQRIGRVNRIGSASGHIYNYVFYPSRQGNREINLTHIALSKIQTFHSTFGEDNQIYSQQEILGRNLEKLFDDSLKEQKEEKNRELPFYEELRNLYLTDRREYNRIAKMSIRSRTGREARTVEGVQLSGDTLVFLKTNFRKTFYLVSDTTREISVVDALTYFKAGKDERPVERIPQHHEHIARALEKFRGKQVKEMHDEEGNTGHAANSANAQVVQAVSLLNQLLPHIDDADMHRKVKDLITLTRRGVITYIAKRLQRIQKNLRHQGSKSGMTLEDALAEVRAMAKRYAPYCQAQEDTAGEIESEAEIILSESFRQ